MNKIMNCLLNTANKFKKTVRNQIKSLIKNHLMTMSTSTANKIFDLLS